MGLPWLMGPTSGAPPPASSAPGYAPGQYPPPSSGYPPSAPAGNAYASQVQQLRQMGFDEASSASALQRTNGNVQQAVDILAGR